MLWPFIRRETHRRPPSLDAAALVQRARRLRFRVRPGAVSQLAGAYHGARPGIGLTFAELRAYEPGDDVRHLDWNVTARQGRPFVRRFVEERALSIWLIVDVSASMRFGAERTTKADRAAQAAALLATAAIHSGDRAGLILVSDRIELELEPAGGARHLSQLVRALVATPTNSPKTKLSAGLARVLRAARRGMLVVISDFVTDEPVGSWRMVARRHDVIALRIIDPCEEKLPAAGIIALQDAEGGRTITVDSSSKKMKERYESAAHERSQVFHRWCAELWNSGLHDGYERRSDCTPDQTLFEPDDPSRCEMKPAFARGLVPPRPNLGPEPWSEPQPIGLYVAVGAVLAGLVAGWLIWRKRQSARRKLAGPDRSDQGPLDISPRGQLVALSYSVRELLVNRNGTAWRAKTIEELSAEPQLVELLGRDQLHELIRFLDQVDHLKFAPQRSNDHHDTLEQELTSWAPRLTELKRIIEANGGQNTKAATARSNQREVNLDVINVEIKPIMR